MYQILPWSAIPRPPHTSSWLRSGPPPDRAAPWSQRGPNQADPDWRLSRIIHLKNLLKGENSYWKRFFVVLQTSFWILQLYISGIYLIESTCVLILSEQICKKILKLIIKVMHTSNNVMNLSCILRFIRSITIYQNRQSKGENSYWKMCL